MKHSLKNQFDLVYIQGKKDSNEKDEINKSNKDEIKLIELGEDDLTKKYNMFNKIDKSKNKSNLNDSMSSKEENELAPDSIVKEKIKDKDLEAFSKIIQY